MGRETKPAVCLTTTPTTTTRRRGDEPRSSDREPKPTVRVRQPLQVRGGGDIGVKDHEERVIENLKDNMDEHDDGVQKLESMGAEYVVAYLELTEADK